jgi:hypothetical protein
MTYGTVKYFKDIEKNNIWVFFGNKSYMNLS